MKARFSLLLSALVLPSLLMLGCGDETGNADLGADMSAAFDMSGNACMTVAMWPSNAIQDVKGEVQVDSDFDFVTSGSAAMTMGSQINLLSAEIWHGSTTPANPRTVTIPKNTTYTSCDTCLFLDEDYDATAKTSAHSYLARGGMVTITKADTNPSSGMIDVSGSAIHFVEWDFDNDKPVTNGQCYDVGSFAIAGTYSNANADGGADM